MSRVIKFRAWENKKWKTFFYGSVGDDFWNWRAKDNHKRAWFHAEWGNPEWTIEQFTGLHDKEGEEIYEGDIVTWPHLSNADTVEVYYNDDEGSFFGRPKNKETESYIDRLCLVIGNIHQNPELLESKAH